MLCNLTKVQNCLSLIWLGGLDEFNVTMQVVQNR